MAKYEELSELFALSFNLNPDIFNINTKDLKDISQYSEINEYPSVNIKNQYFISFFYKEKIKENWESIVLNLHRNNIDAFLKKLNELKDELLIGEIDLGIYEKAIQEGKEFKYEYTTDGLVYIIIIVNQHDAFIDIARIKK